MFRLKNKPNVTLSQPPPNLSAYFISFSFKTYLESGHLHCYHSSSSFFLFSVLGIATISPMLVSTWALPHSRLIAQILTMSTALIVYGFPSSPSTTSLAAFPTNLHHDLSTQALKASLLFPSHEMFIADIHMAYSFIFPSRLC